MADKTPEGRLTPQQDGLRNNHQDQGTRDGQAGPGADAVVSRLDAALAYQAQGRIVVPACTDPCTAPWHDQPCPGKRPLVKIKDRNSVTAEQIQRWWQRWPEAQIAILTGARSNLVVLDIDGPEGEASLRMLEQVLVTLPPTMEVKTKHGRHLYFQHPGGKVLTRKGSQFTTWNEIPQPAPGLDVRADGGLVIAPPSPNRVPANELEPNELPEQWAEPMRTSSSQGHDVDLDEARDWLTEGDPDTDVTEALESYDGHRSSARRLQVTLLGLGQAGHPGTSAAMDTLKAQFLADGHDAHDWDRMLTGAPGQVTVTRDIEELDAKLGDGPSLAELLDDIASGKRVLIPKTDKKPDELHPRTLAILDAALSAGDLDDLPEPELLLPGYLNRAEYVLLSGRFGTYKSFVCLAWAYALATGQSWAGSTPPEPVPVVYVAAEGISGIKKRVRALERRHGVKADDMLTILPRPVHLTNMEEMKGLAMLMAKTKAKLLVLDTWHRMTPGIEENSATDTGGPLDNMLQIRDRFGATILLVHHTGHAQRHARGSSALEDDADASWIITLGKRGEEEEDRSVRNPRTLVQRKAKDGEIRDPGLLVLQVDDQGEATVDATAAELSRQVAGKKGKEPTHAEKVQELIRLMDLDDIDTDLGYRPVMEWDAARRPGESASQAVARDAVNARRGRPMVQTQSIKMMEKFEQARAELKPLDPPPEHPCPACGYTTMDYGPSGRRRCNRFTLCGWEGPTP